MRHGPLRWAADWWDSLPEADKGIMSATALIVIIGAIPVCYWVLTSIGS